ncbi:hypothetical protein GCM10010387_22280 [Streptomyces inusitatus]|uniref:Uncharacterized protein n=1 Tax=Streptomyces inusitatus TaxID=68221 RepID=A0A918PZQ8_9ACTN|nr:hypothetical protein [Streptomyces inusitatus]GGZ28377.1 hypothetical protein GCM10010387_22280 [Streptomyces inusitatus]
MTMRTLQIAVFAISVAGYVALAVTGSATAEYVALVGPVLGAAFLMTQLGRQDQVLTEIKHNTNGVLTARIEAAVKKALDPPE